MSQPNRRSLHAGGICLAVIVLIAANDYLVQAAGPEGPARAFATADAKGIAFAPLASSTRWVVTVTGATGVQVTKLFLDRDRLFLPLIDEAGTPFADGNYAFELRSAAGETLVGRFTVAGGRLAKPAAGAVLRDQVIPDDLIVQGSECVGFDCVNNENFGFDTIRLKENNLRIHFEDTSVGTFPTNDWGIEVNSSLNGGANYFSVVDRTGARMPFRVDAGAPTDALRVDSTGRIGLRTPSPVLDIHTRTSNTPAMRLEQTNAGGFTAQTWDIAGNEANFFVRDVTGGSRLPFRIRPGAPTSSIDISADGDVGLGTASPDHRLHVVGNAAGVVALIQSTVPTGFPGIEYADETGTIGLFVGLDNANNQSRINSVNNNPLVIMTNSAEHVRVDSDGDVGINCNNPTSDLVIASGGACAAPSSSINAGAGAFTTSSSRSLKTNLSPVSVPEILEKIAGINVYGYDFIAGSKNRIGLMAEDFHQIFRRGSDKELSGDEVVMALWLAVQQLAAQNKDLAARVAALDAQRDNPAAVRKR